MKKQRNLTYENKIVNICDKIIEYGIYSLVFFVPIVYSPWTSDVFILPKLTLSMFLILVIFNAWIVKISYIYYMHNFVISHYLFLPILFFTLIIFLSTIFSKFSTVSLYGAYRENQGLLTFITYILLFFTLITNFNTYIKIRKLILFIILGALMVAIYGVFQHLGIDPFFYETNISSRERSYSTIGNPIFLSGYLAMSIPLCVYMIIINKSYLLKSFFLFSAIIISITILFTYSRGGYLAFFSSGLVLGIFYNRVEIKQNKYWLILIFLIFSVVTIYFNKQKIHKGNERINFSQRFFSIIDLKEDAISARLTIWESTLLMIKDASILGIGLDAFGTSFLKYQSPKLAKFEGDFSAATKPHNQFLQLTSTCGFLGLFAFLWVIVTFFLKILHNCKKVKDKNISSLNITLLASIVAYLIYVQFVFDDITTGILFWCYLGMANVKFSDSHNLQKLKIKKLNSVHKIIIISMLLIINVIGIIFIYRLFLSDIYYLQGLRDVREENISIQTIHNLEKAIKLNPSVGVYHHYLGYCYGEIGKWGKAEKELKIAIELMPYYLDSYYLLGKLYEKFNRKNMAIGIYEKTKRVVEKVAPNDVDIYLRLANIYNLIGLKNKAHEEYKKVLDINKKKNKK